MYGTAPTARQGSDRAGGGRRYGTKAGAFPADVDQVGSSRRSAVLPFAVCTVAGILALLAPPYGHAWGQVLVGCVLLLGIGVLAATLPGPVGSWRQFWPALGFLLVFALLRDASVGAAPA